MPHTKPSKLPAPMPRICSCEVNRANTAWRLCFNPRFDTEQKSYIFILIFSVAFATIQNRKGLAASWGVAHLGERLNGIQEVRGSIPLISTKKKSRCKAAFSFLYFSLFLSPLFSVLYRPVNDVFQRKEKSGIEKRFGGFSLCEKHYM